MSTTRLRRDIATSLTEQQLKSLHDSPTSRSFDSEMIAELVSLNPDLEGLSSDTSSTSVTPIPALAELDDAKPTNSSQRPQSYDKQLSAKLHCLYGVPIGTVRKSCESSPPRYPLRSDTADIHPYARSRVYDLRQHTENGTFWGPFLDDGLQTVDWEKLEAIMIILDYNLRRSIEVHSQYEDVLELQESPWVGATPHSFTSPPQSLPMEPSLPLEAQDPYNVTGTWMRVVCFLDYTELYDFNFGNEQPEHDQPRRPIDIEEATRLITMKIKVTKIEEPGEGDGQQLPVVRFNGTSSSIRPSWDANANSKIKGNIHPWPIEIRLITVRHCENDTRGGGQVDNFFCLPRVSISPLWMMTEPDCRCAVRKDGGAKVFRSEAPSLPVVFWASGSTKTLMSMVQRGPLHSGSRMTGSRRRDQHALTDGIILPCLRTKPELMACV